MHDSRRCVVIDDNSDVLALTMETVRQMCPGLKVIGFDSSIDALDFLRANPVDLILTDFRMPFVDGLRLISVVRLINRDVPIVVMSGEPMESAALVAGANAFVFKPALLRDLGAVLDRLGFGAGCAQRPPDAPPLHRRVARRIH